MPVIQLQTIIYSNIEICFDLSRSIDLHIISTKNTKEKAVAGRRNGLIGLNETVTWQAFHFGLKLSMTSLVSKMEPPFYFRDEQVRGPFASFLHDHYFVQKNEGIVLMGDEINFHSPLRWLGRIADELAIRRHLVKLLLGRNNCIRHYAESGKWKEILKDE